MPSVERWYVLSSVLRRFISFIVSGTSMNYLLLYHQWYGGISPFISSVVRWYISLFMPSVERWYVLSSVVRRYISFIVSGTSMNYLLLYHQWYGGISPLYHQWYGGIYLSSCLQWNVGMCYRQCYGVSSLSSSVVRR